MKRKNSTYSAGARRLRRWATWLAGLGLGATGAAAADTNALPPLTPEQAFEGGANSYNNWVEFSTGGFISNGNRANFQKQFQTPGGAFGGINDLHYGTNIDKATTLTIDGRALPTENDYKLKLDLEREKVGYVRVSYREFRTWTDGDGGAVPSLGADFPLQKDALGLDRGNLTLDAGYIPEHGIKAAFKYTHTFREGEEASTSWGDAHLANGAVTQGLSPSFYNIHEHTDSFQLDLSDHIKATDLGLGLHYETARLDDALNITQFPNEPLQQKITSDQGTTYDAGDVHAYANTTVRENLLLSTAFGYTHLDNTFFGSRIYGADFDAGFVPNPQYGFGYYDLSGRSRLNEYVLDLNLLYKPAPSLTITPSLRLQKDYSDEDTAGVETLGANAPVPFAANGNSSDLNARGRLDAAYTGWTNWVLHSRIDLTEAEGDLSQYGGLIPIGGIGIPAVQSDVEGHEFDQKYTAGARWYASRRLVFDGSAYYKNDSYHYADTVDSTPNNGALRYPGYLSVQDLATCDGNVRVTWKAAPNVSLISRYEYAWSTIHTAPDPLAGLPEVESSTMRSHILAQDVSWIPWSRLSLQTGFNCVLSETKTPASDLTQAVLNSENNYWAVTFSSVVVLNDKTDLSIAYYYYNADDYQDNFPSGVPYGAGAQEHAVTATLTRRINDRLRVSLKYGYFHYEDAASGGNADFGVHLVYATLRYRF